MAAGRSWGFWTVGKLDLLESYLDAFTTASKGVGEAIFLDLFAGQSKNVERETDRPIAGSAEIALRVDNSPFTALRFIDLEHAEELRVDLGSLAEGRDVEFIQDDCNVVIGCVLESLRQRSWAPTFAFIDPNGPDCLWSTVEQLAVFKAERRFKVEQWMLFPVDMFTRFLRTDGGEVRPEDAERISRMFGTESWQSIYEARLAGHLQPSDARAEYVNLMRWRLTADLGYRWAHSFDVSTDRRPIYSMVFATDHPAGNDIMTHLYGKALSEFPKMKQEAIDRRTGTLRLFDVEHEPVDYTYEPPLPPYGTRGRQGADLD